ncbi:DUF177 domain-containing protein [Criibacterium bergeronii]|uniref:DUF177 domain-containing protein n=1 Tax=Criibacterium bergeronii TaxID=1871336 RepID=A0A552V918_9FIRM|nr:DUF177 domain-containing protein [Criibacterium bergeronii]MBS6063108.1 DUF177 domain-containing protein [Peptostreptococcaceae bacterium]TRW26973.1 DUF177 domain-containing protein [Criibacterium bergeronii]
MKIQINDLLISSKKNFEYFLELDDVKALSIDGREVRFNSPPRISIKITKDIADELYANVDIAMNVNINCVRCLDDMNVDTTINISGKLVDSDKFSEEDVILITNKELDTKEILEDAAFELLNDNLYCDASCKGLCQTCGANLNHKNCNCDAVGVKIDPRLEKLKDFLN